MNIYGDSILKKVCPLLKENAEKEEAIVLSLPPFNSVVTLQYFTMSINFLFISSYLKLT